MKLRSIKRRIAIFLIAILIVFPLLAAIAVRVAIRANAVASAKLVPDPAIMRQALESSEGNPMARNAASPGRLLWSGSQPPKDYEAYLAFRASGVQADPAVEAYRELMRRKGEEKITETWEKAARAESTAPGWRPGNPILPGHEAWLLAHRDYIAALQAMIAAGGPPLPTAEEILAIDHAQLLKFPLPNFLELQTNAKILAAEAQRLALGGDQGAAADTLADLFRYGLSAREQMLIGGLMSAAMERISSQAAGAWIGHGGMGPETARRLLSAVEANRTTAADITLPLAMEYAAVRGAAVNILAMPLVDGIRHQLNYTNRSIDGLEDDPGAMELLRRRPLDFVGTGIPLLWHKANASDYLAEFDALFGQTAGMYRGSFAELNGFLRENAENGPSSWSPFSQNVIMEPNLAIRAFESETHSNLVRAGLHWISGDRPQPAPPEPDDAWRASPWRDPFTEAPLHRIESERQVQFYSLGPDMADQGGTIAYDPTNGSLSAGDMAIAVRRP